MRKVAKRLYLTASGRVVPEGHPDAATLLYPAGREITEQEAQHWGLDKVAGALEVPAQSKAVSGPPATKAAAHPPQAKRR